MARDAGTFPASIAKLHGKADVLREQLLLAAQQAEAGIAGGRELNKSRSRPTSPQSGRSISRAASLRRSPASTATRTAPTPLPGGPRQQSPGGTTANSRATTEALVGQVQQLELQLAEAHRQCTEAVADQQRRQASYIRREDQMRAQIAELQRQLQQHGRDRSSAMRSATPAASSEAGVVPASAMASGAAAATATAGEALLQPLQQAVMEGVEGLMDQQALHLKAQEVAHLRLFRERLAEVERQLARERQTQAHSKDDWASETVRLRQDLAAAHALVSKLDEMCQAAGRQAATARVELQAQEDDRQLLIRQLMAARRDSYQLRQEATHLHQQVAAIMALARDESGLGDGGEGVSSDVQQRHGDAEAAGTPSWLIGVLEAVAQTRGPRRPISARPSATRSRPTTAGGASRAPPALPQRPSTAGDGGGMAGTAAVIPGNGGGAAGVGAQMLSQEVVEQQMRRYAGVIDSLKRLLQAERRALRQLRTEHASELSRRTELQALLLAGIQDARGQTCLAAQEADPHAWGSANAGVLAGGEWPPSAVTTTQRRVTSVIPVMQRPRSSAATRTQSLRASRLAKERPFTAPDSGAPPGAAACQVNDLPGRESDGPAHPLTQAQWRRVIEGLMTQEQVLTLLYTAAFPPRNASGMAHSHAEAVVGAHTEREGGGRGQELASSSGAGAGFCAPPSGETVDVVYGAVGDARERRLGPFAGQQAAHADGLRSQQQSPPGRDGLFRCSEQPQDPWPPFCDRVRPASHGAAQLSLPRNCQEAPRASGGAAVGALPGPPCAASPSAREAITREGGPQQLLGSHTSAPGAAPDDSMHVLHRPWAMGADALGRSWLSQQ